MNAQQPIAIVIPVFNQRELLAPCVESVQAHTRRAYQLILVDNGSTDGAGAYCDSVAGAVTVHSRHNRGFAGGVNLGLRRVTSGSHVLILNSDTLVPPGWLARLERALLSADDIGMVGPMSNWVAGTQLIPGLAFNHPDEIWRYAEQLACDRDGLVREALRLVGFCILIRNCAFEQVGLFDEAYGIGNYEDDDYGMRVMRQGYRLCVAEDVFVYHHGRKTFDAMDFSGDRATRQMAHNRAVFERKWGMKPPEHYEANHSASLKLNGQARAALEAGDTARALTLYKEAIEMFPPLAINHNDLGVALWQLGHRKAAFEQFKLAVSLQWLNPDARGNLAQAGHALGRSGEAEAALAPPD